MNYVALAGDDSLNLMTHEFRELASGTWFQMAPQGDLWNASVGYTGNMTAAVNMEARMHQASLRVLRGGADDIFLQTYITASMQNFVGTVLFNGVFTKRIGNGQGKITRERWILVNGLYQSTVQVSANTAGETEQAVAEYRFLFPAPTRAV